MPKGESEERKIGLSPKEEERLALTRGRAREECRSRGEGDGLQKRQVWGKMGGESPKKKKIESRG